ncbi:MAG: hypothetical protein GX803_08215 [Lentisphaerae bacterium]|jgi:hypothetical protein|nr:hypothetical protein [Lentisphaerota bacterium]
MPTSRFFVFVLLSPQFYPDGHRTVNECSKKSQKNAAVSPSCRRTIKKRKIAEKWSKNGFFVKFYGFFTKTTARPPLRSDELWVSPFSRSGGRGKPNDQAAQGFSEN